MPGRIHDPDGRAEVKGDVVITPEGLRAQEQRIGCPRLAEKLLRQRRTLIGQIGLLADDGERRRQSSLPQADGELSGRLPGPDHHHRLAIRHDRHEWTATIARHPTAGLRWDGWSRGLLT